MLNIVLFGPPGSGKGTQSEQLIARHKLMHLSTGDLLRSEITAKTELGIQAKGFMDKGALVPDEVVIGMISSKLDKNKSANGFIFDGFPRTVVQADVLDNLLKGKGTAITMMLALEVEQNELIRRLLKRGKNSGRSDDQDESIIMNRIKEYNTKTAPLIDYYSKQSKFISIDGMGGIEDIFNRMCENVDNFIA